MRLPSQKQNKDAIARIAYIHHECPSYFGPHGDSLMVIFIRQTKYNTQQLVYPEKSEWEIVKKTQSDPEGACGEYINIKEKRNNQSEGEYHICWMRSFEWLLQFDLPRILTDKVYFNEYLLKAESGDPDARTLMGSCYAHCLELAKHVGHDRNMGQWAATHRCIIG